MRRHHVNPFTSHSDGTPDTDDELSADEESFRERVTERYMRDHGAGWDKP